ncbi:hypothetical protein FGF1_03330 [Flavobacteriaceae bacterium GF1]
MSYTVTSNGVRLDDIINNSVRVDQLSNTDKVALMNTLFPERVLAEVVNGETVFRDKDGNELFRF